MTPRNDERRPQSRRSPFPTAAHRSAPSTAMEAVREIERLADNALRRLLSGEATTGSSALSKIRYLAQDAARWLS